MHRRYRVEAFLALGATVAWSAWTLAFAASAPEGAKTSKPLHHVTAEDCKGCHEEIYQQWKGSMHGQSTPFQDPIHGAFYEMTVGDPRAEGVLAKETGKYPGCLSCHAPAAALDKKTKLDANPAYSEGVSCTVCHALQTYKGVLLPDGKLRLGTAAYEVSSTTLQAPSGKNYSLQESEKPGPLDPAFHPFPMEGNALLKTNGACMGCHDQRSNPHGVPLCLTGAEYAMGKSFIACQACHMPIVNGMADHSMLGGHSEDMVQQGIVLKVDTERKGESFKTRIGVHNRLPHNFPTGAPFRNVYIKVAAYDASGNMIWQNFKEHPMKEDPKAMFMYMLGDEKGNPAPPPKAKQVLADTRLDPNETRVLEYDIPAENVKVIRVEALYNLLLPSMVKTLDQVLPEELKRPKRAAMTEVRL